jgi:hypothetical protein
LQQNNPVNIAAYLVHTRQPASSDISTLLRNAGERTKHGQFLPLFGYKKARPHLQKVSNLTEGFLCQCQISSTMMGSAETHVSVHSSHHLPLGVKSGGFSINPTIPDSSETAHPFHFQFSSL